MGGWVGRSGFVVDWGWREGTWVIRTEAVEEDDGG